MMTNSAGLVVEQRRHRDIADLGALRAPEVGGAVDACLRRRAYRSVRLVPVADDADAQALRVLPSSAEKSGTGRLALAGSCGSWPAIACSSRAQSSIVQAIGPVWSSELASGRTPDAAAQAVGRLDAGDAAERRRAADGAAGIRAGAAQDQPGGDRRAGAGRGAGGEVVGVPRVARRRPGQVEARAAHGEFVRGELAQHDRAGVGQLLHRGGVCRPAPSPAAAWSARWWRCRRCRRCPCARSGCRRAGRGARPASMRSSAARASAMRAVRRHQDEGVEAWSSGRDAVQAVLRQLDRRELACRDLRARLRRWWASASALAPAGRSAPVRPPARDPARAPAAASARYTPRPDTARRSSPAAG